MKIIKFSSKEYNNHISHLSFDDVFSFNNLKRASVNCLKGNNWKNKTQQFAKNMLFNVYKIHNDLKEGKYKPRPTNNFEIDERGKKRNIYSYEIRDRVVFKCFCDNYLNPLFTKSLIFDCPASVCQKGINFAKDRVKLMLRKYYNKFKTNKGYVLKIDISSYFANINHQKLLEIVKPKIIDKKLYELFELIIKDNDNNASFNTKGIGLGLGSQLSQICALIYLNKVDHYIKEELKIKYYERYMDDMCIIHKDLKQIKKVLKDVIKMFHDLGLHLNQKATRIYKLDKSFKFLKMRITLTNSGKIFVHNTTKTFSKIKRKILYLLAENKIKDVERIISSWTPYGLYGDDYIRFKNTLKKCGLYYVFKTKKLLYKTNNKRVK